MFTGKLCIPAVVQLKSVVKIINY